MMTIIENEMFTQAFVEHLPNIGNATFQVYFHDHFSMRLIPRGPKWQFTGKKGFFISILSYLFDVSNISYLQEKFSDQ